jgi:hypothetical protein
MNYRGFLAMSQTSEKVSIEEMWKALEEFGVKRDMLEKLHPSSETLSHLYSSIKQQKIEHPN